MKRLLLAMLLIASLAGCGARTQAPAAQPPTETRQALGKPDAAERNQTAKPRSTEGAPLAKRQGAEKSADGAEPQHAGTDGKRRDDGRTRDVERPPAERAPARKKPAAPKREEPRSAREPGPHPAAPRQPGVYRYDTDGSMTVTGGFPRRLPDVTTLTVGSAENGRQHAVRDLRDRSNGGQVTETTQHYEHAGVLLSYVKVHTDLGGGVSTSREWHVKPPELIAPTGAEPGTRRRFTMRNSDTTARVTIDLLRREPVTVAGTRTNTMVVRTHIELSGSLNGTQTTHAWLRANDLLALREEVDSDVSNGTVRMQMSYRATIQSTRPS